MRPFLESLLICRGLSTIFHGQKLLLLSSGNKRPFRFWERTHLEPKAKQCLRARAEFTLADAFYDGKSKSGTWTEHVEMLKDSFRDLEDSGCTLSEESKNET